MALHVHDYLPLIVQRIEFQPNPTPLPAITARTEYTPDVIAYIEAERQAMEEEDSSGGEHDERHGPAIAGPASDPTARATTSRSTRQAPSAITDAHASSSIPKPPGEPGRRQGGFNTDEVLINLHNWTKEDVERLKARIYHQDNVALLNVLKSFQQAQVRACAKQELNLTVSFRKQAKEKVDKVCCMMMEDDKFPILKNYKDCWPVTSILKLNLKYNAEAAKRLNYKTVNTRILAAAMRGQTPAAFIDEPTSD